MNLLARREHSYLELSNKLLQRQYPADEIESTLHRLIEDGLLSNERFTEAYINMRRKRGFGPLRIENELRERGIDGQLIAQFLCSDYESWWPDLQQQYQKKYGARPPADYAEKARRVKFLQGRGYPLEWIFKLPESQGTEYSETD